MTRSHLSELVRLQAINVHSQLSLVALHCGHGRNHVVDDGAQLDELLVRGLGIGRW
jgi:hypothetical protein